MNKTSPTRSDKAIQTFIQDLSASGTTLDCQNWQLSLLLDYTVTVNRMVEADDILKFSLPFLMDHCGLEWAAAYRLDEGGRSQTYLCSNNSLDPNLDIENFRLRLGNYYTEKAAQSREPLFISDLNTDKQFKGLWSDPDQSRSYVVLPFFTQEQPAGALELVTLPGKPFSEQHFKLLQIIAHELGVATEKALIFSESVTNERETETLYQIGLRISSAVGLPQVLNAITDGARHLLNTDMGLVGLADEKGEFTVIEAASGLGAEALMGLKIPIQGTLPDDPLDSRKSILLDQDDPSSQKLPHTIERMVSRSQSGSFLAVPLEHGQAILGVLGVISNRRRRYSAREMRLLERLALQVVVSIQNAQLDQQTRSLSVLAERTRLAAEMHDNLAQALAGINLSLANLEHQLEGGQSDRAIHTLQELRTFSQETYNDVRVSIFNLRAEIGPGKDFLPDLEKFVTDFGKRFNLRVRMDVEPELSLDLPPETSLQVGRVIQEALSNVRKHAQATGIAVQVARLDDRLRITIEDDGVGFNPDLEAGETEGFGLQIMRERMTSVGGDLEIESLPGQGVQVRIYLCETKPPCP